MRVHHGAILLGVAPAHEHHLDATLLQPRLELGEILDDRLTETARGRPVHEQHAAPFEVLQSHDRIIDVGKLERWERSSDGDAPRRLGRMGVTDLGDHLLDRVHLHQDPALLLEQLIHDADQQDQDEELNDRETQDGCAHPTPLRVPLDLSVLPTVKVLGRSTYHFEGTLCPKGQRGQIPVGHTTPLRNVRGGRTR